MANFEKEAAATDLSIQQSLEPLDIFKKGTFGTNSAVLSMKKFAAYKVSYVLEIYRAELMPRARKRFEIVKEHC